MCGVAASILFALGGCAGPGRVAGTGPGDGRTALPAALRSLLQKLPADADRSRPYEELLKAYQAGVYRTKSGVFKLLPADAPAAIRPLEGRPPVRDEKADLRPFKPISLDLPPAAASD